MKNLIRFAFVLLPLASFANEKPAATTSAPQRAMLPATTLAAPTAERLAPIASVPVTPSAPATSVSVPSNLPTANTIATTDAAANKTIVKAKREGFFKRAFKKMKQQLNTYVLVGLILVGVGLLVAIVASGILGALFIIAGGVFIILGVI